ncbi:TFIIB-type zinc ribbon-containing protein [Candidatus Saccharibacteria bacterium]|nr:TFIIB-type zinc ribbon-containing protein [Candidatus Saccharibacteria bacterium]
MAKKEPKNGLNRCPKCGATDISLDTKSGKLRCNYCRALFDGEIANESGDISKLSGRNVGSGAKDIIPDKKTILTFECSSCGASIVINADEATSAKCHWCRHVLSINEQIDNGAVPDMVLPFKLDKATAEGKIKDFVGRRQFYAHPVFKKEFTTENIMGVYLPYMVIDVNAHASFAGEAEHQTRSYYVTRRVGDHTVQDHYYDADAYNVTRDFDLTIDDLTIEASSDKLNQNNLVNTTNVINAVMPFDTENCVKWDANYLRGYASEKRDTNIDVLVEPVKAQALDVARFKVKETMGFYDRGAKWESEKMDIKGTDWKATYLPLWLYSYLQKDGEKKLLHYVAVNARTGETMGSVPIYKAKLIAISAIIEFFSVIFGGCWMFWWFSGDDIGYAGLAGVAPGIVYYLIIKNKYRNATARHRHESETKCESKNIKKTDKFKEKRTRLRSATIAGKNSDNVNGVIAKGGWQEKLTEKLKDQANFSNNIAIKKD